MLVGENAHARTQHVVARRELADRLAEPAHAAVARRARTARRGAWTSFAARASISPASAFCAAARSALPSGPAEAESAANWKPASRPIGWPSTTTSPDFGDFGFEHCVLAQPPHQHAGAAVDEALGQTLVQRVGQPVLDAARDALPVLGIGEPVRAVCRKGPGPDVGDPVRERIDIAVGAVRLRNLRGEPVGRDCTLPHQETIEGRRPSRHGRRARSCDSPEPGRPPTAARSRRAMWPKRAPRRRAKHAPALGYLRRSARA